MHATVSCQYPVEYKHSWCVVTRTEWPTGSMESKRIMTMEMQIFTTSLLLQSTHTLYQWGGQLEPDPQYPLECKHSLCVVQAGPGSMESKRILILVTMEIQIFTTSWLLQSKHNTYQRGGNWNLIPNILLVQIFMTHATMSAGQLGGHDDPLGLACSQAGSSPQ